MQKPWSGLQRQLSPAADITPQMLTLLGAKSRREQVQQTVSLFDYFVGEQLDRVRHLDAEQSRRLRVDYELEFCRLQDRQVGGLRAFEDLPGVDADLTVRVRTFGRGAHQTPGFNSLATVISRRNPIVRRERHKLGAAAEKEDIGGNQQGIGPVANEGGEGRLNLTAGAGVEDVSLQSEDAGRFGYVSQRGFGNLSI